MFTPTQDTVIYGEFRAKYTFNIQATATQGGNVAGSGSYVEGEQVRLYAASEPTYRFVGWYQGGNLVSADTMYEFTAQSDGEYVAKFEPYSKWESSIDTPSTDSSSGSNDSTMDSTNDGVDSTINNSDTTDTQQSGGCKSTLTSSVGLLSAVACLGIFKKKKRA